MYMCVAQIPGGFRNVKKYHESSVSTKVVYHTPNSLAEREGPSTSACKSKNADRQDWYILPRVLVNT